MPDILPDEKSGVPSSVKGKLFACIGDNSKLNIPLLCIEWYFCPGLYE